jgi:hypothetical protein
MITQRSIKLLECKIELDNKRTIHAESYINVWYGYTGNMNPFHGEYGRGLKCENQMLETVNGGVKYVGICKQITNKQDKYPSLRSQYAPPAEDPRCARMTTTNIPLCYKTAEGTKINARANYYIRKDYTSLRSHSFPLRGEIPDQERYDELLADRYPITAEGTNGHARANYILRKDYTSGRMPDQERYDELLADRYPITAEGTNSHARANYILRKDYTSGRMPDQERKDEKRTEHPITIEGTKINARANYCFLTEYDIIKKILMNFIVNSKEFITNSLEFNTNSKGFKANSRDDRTNSKGFKTNSKEFRVNSKDDKTNSKEFKVNSKDFEVNSRDDKIYLKKEIDENEYIIVTNKQIMMA